MRLHGSSAVRGKNWPQHLYGYNRTWDQRWDAGRCVRVRSGTSTPLHSPFGSHAGDRPDWTFNARDCSEMPWLKEQGFKVEVNHAGLSTITDFQGNLFQEEVIVDRQVICRDWSHGGLELGIVDIDDRCHRVGSATTSQVCAVNFGRHNHPSDDVSLLRYQVLEQQHHRPASLYETMAYAAKFFDRHVGQILVPCAGWSQKGHRAHTGIPMFWCERDNVVVDWRKHSGCGWNDKARFLAVEK